MIREKFELGSELKDMTGDEYAERILKEVYKDTVISVLKEAMTTGRKEHAFIYVEIKDPMYVTRLELDEDLDFLTEEPGGSIGRAYMPSMNKYEILLKSLLEYCGSKRIAILGTRDWYEKEVAPELQLLLDIADL